MEKLLELTEMAGGITCDSRQVKPGYIFVAIRGRTADGNSFAAMAEKNGAIAVITECPATLPPLSIPAIAVSDARQTLADISAAFYHHPSRALALTGITGTNGKTTVSFMLDQIFRQAGFKTGLIGTVCINTGTASFPSSLTTPDAAALQGYLAMMRQSGVTHATMEVSAQGMELKRVHGVNFACGLLINLSPDHLDFHGSFAAYLDAKRQFPALLGTAPLVVNNDDPLCRRIALTHSGTVMTVGLESNADVTAKITRLNSFGSVFQLTWIMPPSLAGGENSCSGSALFSLPLPGRHNVANAAMAAAAALAQGIPAPVIARALTTFVPVSRRMEVSGLAGMTVVDDTALNPGSIDAIFNTISTFRYRRLIIVNAIRGCRGTAINVANADTLAAWWHRQPFSLIVTAAAGNVGPADSVLENEKSAFLEALEKNNTIYSFADTLTVAIEKALAAAASGDLLLLLGAQGMDNGYQVLRHLLAAKPEATASRRLAAAEALV